MSASVLTQAEKEAIIRARKKARLQDPNRLKFIIGEEKTLSKPSKSTTELAADQTLGGTTETKKTAPTSTAEDQDDAVPAQQPATITVQHHTHDLVTPIDTEGDGEPPVPIVRIRNPKPVGVFGRGLLSESTSLADEAALGLDDDLQLQSLFSTPPMSPSSGSGARARQPSMFDQAQMASQLMSLLSSGNNGLGGGEGGAGGMPSPASLFGAAFGGSAPAVPVSRWANLGNNLLITTLSIILAMLCSFGIMGSMPTFTSMNLILAFIFSKILAIIATGGASGLLKVASGPFNLFSLFAHYRSVSGLWDDFILFLFCFVGTYSFLHLV